MKNSFLLCVAFIACFGVGFVCGMFAQSRIIDGCSETIVLVNSDVTDEPAIKCLDGSSPDVHGCCAGEVYTYMGENGWNCCPDVGDCFPPILTGN